MTIATGTFVVLNANYPACSWPGVSEGAVPIELAGPLGPVGNAHRVYEVRGLPASCAIKMGPGAECPEDEKDVRQVAMQLGARDSLWGEYEKLLAADGLCGRAPLAYAYGAFVEASDGGRARISPAFVMERLDAEPLCHVVERGALPVRRVIEAGLMLADLVDDLARRRISHGNLSPENVLIEAGDADEVERACVVDFQLAVSRDEEGGRIGSLPFTAPEQIGLSLVGCNPREWYLRRLSREPYADMWSVGALLYYMATGERPALPVRWGKGSDGAYSFWYGGQRLEFEEALACVNDSKIDGLDLPGPWRDEEGGPTLGSAIRLCTSNAACEREIAIVRGMLEEALR